MGHAFITRSSFHQLLAPPLSLPTAEPSVPEVSVTGDNMSPRWGVGGKPRTHRSSNDYLIRLFTLDLKDERGTKWRLLPICSALAERGSREERELPIRWRRGGGDRDTFSLWLLWYFFYTTAANYVADFIFYIFVSISLAFSFPNSDSCPEELKSSDCCAFTCRCYKVVKKDPYISQR